MVRLVVSEVTIPSVRDALARSHAKKNTGDAVKKRQHMNHPFSSLAPVPMPYPVGSNTLQLTGVQVSLQQPGKKGSTAGAGLVMLLRAHIKGELDATERVFTIAGLKVGDSEEEASGPAAKRRAVNAVHDAVVPGSTSLRCTAFAKLDLRLQMEEVSFSVELLPAAGRYWPSNNSATGGNRQLEEEDSSAVVTVFGVVSSLVPP